MTTTRQNWPERLWLVRHGQSQGNVARDAADEAGAHEIDIDMRDVDVPLSELGRRQAEAAGRWFAALPRTERPEIILSSPYVRAKQTAAIICEQGALAGGPAKTIVDERLREREFGIFDRLTTLGIRERFPDEAAHRRRLGKFYHRPPGGESWCDVILRLRSVLDTITREHRRERVLIVGHQVTVNCLRYLFERLSEAEILDVDRRADVPNCSVTSYTFDPTAGRNGKLVLDLVNFVAPLTEAGTPVTSAPDVPAAPKS